MLGVVGQAIAADNPHLTKARAHVDALELDLAQGELDLALRAGDGDRASVAEIYRLLGVVTAALDQTAAAQEHFRHLLALEPTATAPDAYGPKIVAPFAEAQAALKTRAPMSLVLEGVPPEATEIGIVVGSDPAGMIASIQVRFDTGATATASGPRSLVPLPKGATRVSLVAVDAFGNRLLEQDEAIRVERPNPPLGRPEPPPAPPGFFGRWPVWAVTSGVFLATGVGLALAAKSTQDDLDALKDGATPPSYSEVHDLDTKGRRLTLGANVAFGVGAATGVVAAVLFFRAPSSSSSIAVAPTDGGAALGVTTRF